MAFLWLFLVSSIFYLSESKISSSNKYLKNYEVVPIDFYRSGVWGQAWTPKPWYKFKFQAFNKTFEGIITKQDHGITDERTKLDIGGYNIPFDDNLIWTYMSGYLLGDTNTSIYGMVSLEKINPDSFIGVINTKSGSYGVEPYGREHGTLKIMVYQYDDMTDPNCDGDKCGKMEPYVGNQSSLPYRNIPKVIRATANVTQAQNFSHLRGKECGVEVAIDNTFIAANEDNKDKALSAVVLMMTMVNEALRKTDFDQDGFPENIGLFIEKIGIIRATMNDSASDKEQLLKTYFFGCARRNSESCISLCLTHRNFAGLAGMASLPDSFEANDKKSPVLSSGICAKPTKPQKDSKLRNFTLNVAVITTNRGMTSYSAPIIQTASIILHHIGHLMGADHDPPSDAQCSPPDAPHVMTTLLDKMAKGGQAFNFSQCSTQQIWKHLKTNAQCFNSSKTPYCGNTIVEGGEDCDCGNPTECDAVDPCCVPMGGLEGQKPCTIRKPFECSPRVDKCCSEKCMPRSREDEYVCNRSTNDCMLSAKCDGKTSKCPSMALAEDKTPCLSNYRTCKNGTCSSTKCEDNSKEECECREREMKCVLCCKDDSGKCFPSFLLPFSTVEEVIYRPRGFPCNEFHGQCNNEGKCIAAPIRRRSRTAGEWFGANWAIFIVILLIIVLVGLLKRLFDNKKEIKKLKEAKEAKEAKKKEAPSEAARPPE